MQQYTAERRLGGTKKRLGSLRCVLLRGGTAIHSFVFSCVLLLYISFHSLFFAFPTLLLFFSLFSPPFLRFPANLTAPARWFLPPRAASISPLSFQFSSDAPFVFVCICSSSSSLEPADKVPLLPFYNSPFPNLVLVYTLCPPAVTTAPPVPFP